MKKILYSYYNWMTDNKYCIKCGKKNSIYYFNTFDKDTGKKDYVLVCKNKMCELGEDYYAQIEQMKLEKIYCQNGHTYSKKHWLQVLRGTGENCVKCGDRISNADYSV